MDQEPSPPITATTMKRGISNLVESAEEASTRSLLLQQQQEPSTGTVASPVQKKQRGCSSPSWHHRQPRLLSPDMMNERLVHLNQVAIQCLQTGECDKAQRYLLSALDLIKARHLGIGVEQASPRNASITGCRTSTRSLLDDDDDDDAAATATTTNHSVVSRLLDNHGAATPADQPPLVGPPPPQPEPQQPPPQPQSAPVTMTTSYDEGFRASMEPLHFSSPSGHPASQQAAIIYYNVGISFLCFHKPKGARQWFKLALICFEDGAAGNGADADPRIMARLHHNIGFCLKDESPDRAVQAYRLALILASQSSDLSTGSFLASIFNSIGVLLYRMGQYESALVYLQDSLGHFRALGSNTKYILDVATVTHNIGRVYFAQLEFGLALDGFERALTLRRRYKETSVVDLAASLCSVGSTLEKLSREDEAVEFYAELIDLDCLESSAVDLTLVCSALANIYKNQGKLNDARQLYEKAARVGRTCLGETHPVVAGSLKELADCHLKNGDAAQAIENYKAALELEQLASEKTHNKTVKVLYSIALLYQKVGQYAAALEKFTMVYKLQKKKYGAASKAAQKPRVSMAEMEYRLKNYDRALKIYEGLLLLNQKTGNDNDGTGCSYLMNSLGIVSFAKCDYAAASHYFQACLNARTTWSADSATVLYNLATAEEKLGRHERAIECFEQSLAMDEATSSSATVKVTVKCETNSNVILDTLQRLGRMYQIAGDLHRALDCATKALQRLDYANDTGSLVVRAKLQNLSGNLHLQLGNVGSMMDCYTQALGLFRAAGHENNEALIIAGFYLYGFSKLHPPCAEMA